MTLIAQGKCSWFGGPNDTGVAPDEGLALLQPADLIDPRWRDLFLRSQPPGTSGLARRLDPTAFFLAYRFPKSWKVREWLRSHQVRVRSEAVPEGFLACVVDWGPSQNITDRDVDLSLGLLNALRVKTGGQVWVETLEDHAAPHPSPVPPEGPTTVAAPTAAPTAVPVPLVRNGTTQKGVVGPGGSPVSFSTTWKRFTSFLSDEQNRQLISDVITGLHEAETTFNAGTGQEKKKLVMSRAAPFLDAGISKLGPLGELLRPVIIQAAGAWVDQLVSFHFPHPAATGEAP